MDQWRDYAPGGAFAATWTDGIEALLSNYVSPNFRLTVSNPGVSGTPSAVQLSASADDGVVSLAIQGKPRWITAPLSVNIPLATGVAYDIYATSTADTFGSDPGPPVHETDTTDHSFALAVVAQGATPGTALYRKVGTAYYDGNYATVLNTVGPWANTNEVPTPLLGGRLPSPRYDGQIADLAVDSSTPWRFRFDAANMRWVFQGGAWWRPTTATNLTQALGPSPASGWAATTGGGADPALTPPLNGDYSIYFSAEVWGNTGCTSSTIAVRQTGFLTPIEQAIVQSAAPIPVMTLTRIVPKATLVNTAALALIHAATGGTYNVRYREIALLPIQIPITSWTP